MGRNGLSDCLDLIIDLENRLEERLAFLLTATERYLEAPGIIGALQTLVAGQREALQTHALSLDTTDIPPIGSAISAALEASPEPSPETQDVLTMLRGLAVAFTQAAFGYALLHALAHRSYDVRTANLADEHRMAYLRAVGTVHRAVGDVAVQELHESGHVCRCQCPACGPGICICWHVHIDQTCEDALAEGIVVRSPRTPSNAEHAGLRHGDVVLWVDDQVVRSYEDMRDGMGRHQPGEEVKLRVQRGSGELQDVTIIR